MKFKQIMLIGVGAILGGALSISTAVNANPSIGNNSISEVNSEEAKKIMLNKVPGAKITKFEFDSDGKIKKYDGTLIKDNIEYEIDVDSKTGEIIKFEKENIRIGKDTTVKNSTSQNNNNFIGENKARELMLNKVPGAKVISFYLDNDNTPEYEGKLIKNNKEYEISIDAKTGDILDFSEEVIKISSSDNKNNTNTTVNKPVVNQGNTNNATANKPVVNQGNTNNATVNKPIVNQNTANKYFDDDRYDDDRYDNDIDDRYDDDRYDNDIDDRYDDDRYDNDIDDRYDDDRYDD
ncbi:PepSY domain-containing protein [Clostridium perfringens]|uniref:PepSY domain-containing protein n=1 Tax=Clostridium perfringens TaxID=1502 RepID=UPI001B830DC6|nr:PepSY domain-containing protein [Clostridium perfringens]HBC2032010.1 PepSY domain-containing protein [Clostridium perfringens]HBC2055745.1 PepSY domain-containing protein [Clostridium perfringens]HBC2069361.1 PepSY domain-containing protein [Clostridium perfringens]